jgi:excisionase family DNA binding protein
MLTTSKREEGTLTASDGVALKSRPSEGSRAVQAAFGRLLDVKQVAELLGLGERTVWSYAGSGKMPAPKHVGRRRLWSLRELEKWVDNGCPKREPGWP